MKPLEEVAKIGAGNPAPQDPAAFTGGRHPFIRTSDVGQVRFGEIASAADKVNDATAKRLRKVPAGTILMPKSGASTFLNHRVITQQDAFVSSHLATVIAKGEACLPRYLLYFLSTVRAQESLPDNTYPSLNLSIICGIPVMLPPLEEQHRIVAVLDEAHDGLARARAYIEANLAASEALFESHLEKLLSKISSSTGATYRPISEALFFQEGPGIRKYEYADQGEPGFPMINVRCVQDGRVDMSNARSAKAELARGKWSHFQVRSGDILFTTSGTIGRCAIVSESDLPAFVPQAGTAQSCGV